MKKILLSSFILSAYLQVDAQQTTVQNALFTQSPTLELYRGTFSARSAAMANSTVATNTPGTAIFSNLATLPWSNATAESDGITENSYTTGYSNRIMYSAFTHAHEGNYFSCAVTYFNGGTLASSYQQGIDHYDWAIEAGFAKQFADNWSFSVSPKLVESSITDATIQQNQLIANALSIDLACYYDNVDIEGNGQSAGMVVSNLGTMLNYGYNIQRLLPAAFAIGAAQHWLIGMTDHVTLSLQYSKSIAVSLPQSIEEAKHVDAGEIIGHWLNPIEDPAVSLGAEYRLSLSGHTTYSAIAFRGGYMFDRASNDYSGITAGVGLTLHRFHGDVAYIQTRGSTSPIAGPYLTISYGL